MKKSISRIIGLTMLIIAIVFIMFALNHPEKSLVPSRFMRKIVCRLRQT